MAFGVGTHRLRMCRLSSGEAPRNARAPGGMEGLLRLELSGRWAFIEAESLDKPSKALSPVMCCHEKLKRTLELYSCLVLGGI